MLQRMYRSSNPRLSAGHSSQVTRSPTPLLRLPRHLLKPLDQPLALEPRKPVDPEQAVELVDLVLVADGAQAVRLFGLPIAVDILIADPDARMTLDLVGDAGHRDAAFAVQDHLGGCPLNLRIDVSARAFVCAEV